MGANEGSVWTLKRIDRSNLRRSHLGASSFGSSLTRSRQAPSGLCQSPWLLGSMCPLGGSSGSSVQVKGILRENLWMMFFFILLGNLTLTVFVWHSNIPQQSPNTP